MVGRPQGLVEALGGRGSVCDFQSMSAEVEGECNFSP